MAEEKVEPRETSWRQLLPWTELFRGFQVALDVNKLALAAVGILVMAFGWWLLAVLFTAGEQAAAPSWHGDYSTQNPNREAWKQIKQARNHWNLMHETAGVGGPEANGALVDENDLLDTYDESQLYEAAIAAYEGSADRRAKATTTRDEALAALTAAKKMPAATKEETTARDAAVKGATKKLGDADAALQSLRVGNLVSLFTDEQLSKDHNDAKIPEKRASKLAALYLGAPREVKRYAQLASWPWFEDRGPNPYLMATGQLGKPWETGQFWDWLWLKEVPVLLEPIVKLLLPVRYLFDPVADVWCRFYFLCVLLWAVLTWAVFGGAITRIAAVQVARGEKISAMEALNFTRKRLGSYIAAPMIPVAIMVLLLIGMILYGFPLMIPIFGDIIVAGLFWPIMIVVGLLLAITLVGLVGWPFMSVTISAQGGTDVWDAFTRAYSYVYQKPWHFIWYTVVAVVYGAIIVFFIGFMASLTVYLGKWGVSQTPGMAAAGRQPSYLFVYAPTSYHWRDLLLRGAEVGGEPIVGSDDQIIPAAYQKWTGRDDTYKGKDRLEWWNLIGAFLVAIWLWIAFLLLIGFSYSYFWSASTIVYLLMRRKVDGEDMDEVTLEDEGEGGFAGAPLGAPTTAAPPAGIKAGATPLTMVDAPSLRPPIPPSSAPPPPSVPPPVAPSPIPEATAAPIPPSPALTPPAEDGGAAPRSEVGAAPPEPLP